MKYAIVIADGTRARLMSYELTRGTRRAKLIERETMANPELRQPPHERFRQARHECAARNFGEHYSLDDHRSRHDAEVERRFATRVNEALLRFADELGAPRVCVVADPKMLGHLRASRAGFARRRLAVKDHACELAGRTITEIQEYLESAKLISIPNQA